MHQVQFGSWNTPVVVLVMLLSLIRCDNAIIPRFTVFANGWTPIFAESLQGEQRLLCCGGLLEIGGFLSNLSCSEMLAV